MERENDQALREHLDEVLSGESAHISLEAALSDFPLEHINTHLDGAPHTAWQLLEHMRIAQWDILDFSGNPNYQEMKWPDDYWPNGPGTVENWHESVKRLFDDLKAMRGLVADKNADLFAKIPHGTGQTILREALLVADHNAYHLGQLVMLKKMFSKTVA
jgi:DinB superfamily